LIDRSRLLSLYHDVRRTTEALCQPLLPEDHVIQSMPDVSPPKWHLGHTTWFFEQLVLSVAVPAYKQFHPLYPSIFNSYYESFGERVPRENRGTLSRPSVDEVRRYRAFVDEQMGRFLSDCESAIYDMVADRIELGLHHEQQHQELLVMDIKHIFASNPLHPVYDLPRTLPSAAARRSSAPAAVKFLPVSGGIVQIGAPEEGFAYDNERPRHAVLLRDFCLMNRLVTCGEYLDFIKDGGYQNPLLWLSDGWDIVRRAGWQAPLYWQSPEGEWQLLTLSGAQALNLDEPVAHVSFYEASAFARWAGKRLPTEFEWERASAMLRIPSSCGNFLEDGHLHPLPQSKAPAIDSSGLSQMFGDLWEWTGSAYLPYPGYKQESGPMGEYNGKFMNNQMVLRGGCCATPRQHIRASYRNFFPPDKRWQFSGIRLASDLV